MSEWRAWVVAMLMDWAETFDNEDDGDAWEEIEALAKKLKRGKCKKKDFENILFHLWQKLGQDGDA